MNYLILTGVILSTVALFFLYRRLTYSNFDKYADLSVNVLLDQNNGDFNSQYGCIIFQLPSYGEHVKEVVITGVQSSNKHIRVNAFEKMNFFITPGEATGSAMRSIGFSISNRALQSYNGKQESLLIRGYIVNRQGEKKIFMKTAYYTLQDFSKERVSNEFRKSNDLAV